VPSRAVQALLTAVCAGVLAIRGAAAADAPLEKDLTVELHAHLFMEEGMGLMIRGSFHDPLCAADHWTDRFSVQANAQGMKDSHVGITVLALYAHPIFEGDLLRSIRAQLAQVRRFVGENPEFVLARSPWEARRALRAGKRVIILGLEGAAGIVDTDDLVREFVDEAGIRIIAPLHLTDDHLGGGAFLAGINILANPLAFLKQFFNQERGEYGERLNRNGITERGMSLMRQLIERRVWIDLSHATDQAFAKMAPVLREAGQPILVTHSALRRHYRGERGVSDTHLQQMAQSHGYLGLMPSQDMVETTRVRQAFCPPGCRNCEGGIFAFATHYADAVEVLGPNSVAFGSDFNGGIRHLPPPECAIGLPEFDQEGFYLMSHTPRAWAALRKVGAPVPEDLTVTVEAFLAGWEKVYGREPGVQ
jgi:microsomal dipeptidase-like Zn-dependent dipeptidase